MKRTVFVLSFLAVFASSVFGQNSKLDKKLNDKINGLRSGATKASETVRVIVQTKGDPDGQGVSSHISSLGGKVLQKFSTFSGAVAEVPARSIAGVASHSGVSGVSLDGKAKGHATSSTTLTPDPIQSYLAMFDNNRDTTGGPEGWFKYGVAGLGIGVAVIDSGIAPVADLPNVMKTV